MLLVAIAQMKGSMAAAVVVVRVVVVAGVNVIEAHATSTLLLLASLICEAWIIIQLWLPSADQ